MPKPDSPSEVIAKAQKKAKRNRWQDAYYLQVKQAGLPLPTPEVSPFPDHKPRYRWDFCYREALILIEIQGGIWARDKDGRPKPSGHTTGAGINRDCDKSNLANLNSYCCLSFTSDMIRSGVALEQTREALRLFTPF